MTKSKNTVDIIEKHGTWRFKVRHGLLQIATGNTKVRWLLQIATGITKCNDYYKLRQYIVTLYLVNVPPGHQRDWKMPENSISVCKTLLLSLTKI